MPGFQRRFSTYPSLEEILAIEGVVIVDADAPGGINGVGVGTVAVIGEFADMTYAVSVDTSGNVTTKVQPIEVFGGQDLLDKGGPFDFSLGNFGVAFGNGQCFLDKKVFSRLVIVPVNLCSSKAIRVMRQLPTNTSAIDVTPIVSVDAALIPAGTEFSDGTDYAKTAAPVRFTGDLPRVSGIDGVLATSTPTLFESASGNFVENEVQEGDALVLGSLNAASGVNLTFAKTYRIKSVTDDDTLVIENQDGTSPAFTDGTALAWRIHPAATADSGSDHQFSEAAGWTIPARALGPGSISTSVTLDPTSPAVTPSGSAWEPASGLMAITHSVTGLAYTATIQAENAVNDATIDALYQDCFDGLITEDLPAREVSIVVAARTSPTIRLAGVAHVLLASQQGMGRMFLSGPLLTTVSPTTVLGDTGDGVGVKRNERHVLVWPAVSQKINAAVNQSIKGADGYFYDDGVVDVPAWSYLASILSTLQPERDPGQAEDPVATIMSTVIGLQRGVTGLNINHYKAFKQKGIVALRMDRKVGAIFQSGVTTSLVSQRTTINRRRFADYLQDSMGERLVLFSKLPLTNKLQGDVLGEADDFLSLLKSKNNPDAQRISDYILDPKSGNSAATIAKGVYALTGKVEMTPILLAILINIQVGSGVIEVTAD